MILLGLFLVNSLFINYRGPLCRSMAMNHSGAVKPLQQSSAREDLSPLRNTAQRASIG